MAEPRGVSAIDTIERPILPPLPPAIHAVRNRPLHRARPLAVVESTVVDETPVVQEVGEFPIIDSDVEVFTAPEALAPPEPTPMVAVEVHDSVSGVAMNKDPSDSPLGLDNKKLLIGLFAAFVVVVGIAGIRLTGMVTDTSLVTSLEQGECIEDFFTPNQGEFREVFLVGTTDCSNPHAYEVYAVGESVYAESQYPGIDGVFEVAQSYCDQQYNSFVGGDFLSSPWNVWTFAPTQDRWNAGERNVQCIVGDFDQTTLTTGTLRNAGR